MAGRKNKDPSPLKAGIVHGALSLAVFGGVSAIAAGAIHIGGSPDAGSPTYRVALFQTDATDVGNLRERTPGIGRSVLASADANPTDDGAGSNEPNLGVADPAAVIQVADATPRAATPDAAPAQRGIRINGKIVYPGQSLSGVEAGNSVAGAANTPVSNAGKLEAEPANLSTLENTRPFQNPDNKPIVSLIVGGLGASTKETISAIDELPADVTLAFVPNARAEFIRYAREKGHEVLVEVPMEASVQGRARPHRDMLLANADGEQNVLRLKSICLLYTSDAADE